MKPSLATEVCVLGAGPAGSAIGRRLAQLGHSVIIVEKSRFPRCHIGESLAGSVLPLLEILELRALVEAAGFFRPQRAIVHWAGHRDYDRSTHGDPGFQVDRGAFDALLLDGAVRSGAILLQPAKVLDLQRRAGTWLIDVRVAEETCRIEARFLVDASGRTNLSGGKRRRTSAPVLALWAYWKSTPASGTETRVESGPHEWFWGAPLPDGTFNATVFLDPGRYREGIQRFGFRDAFYEALLAESQLLGNCQSGARCTPVKVCDATCFLAEDMVTADSIKVGEAAFAIDPLSSQGVQTAIGTALHAAAVLHTVAGMPENTRAALDFYAGRQRAAADLHAASAAAFYKRGAEFYGTDFWRRHVAATGQRVPERKALRKQPALPGAETLIQLSRDAQLTSVPCLQGDYIVETLGLTHPNLDDLLVFAEDMEVVPLLEETRNPVRVRELVPRWSQRIGQDLALRTLCHFWKLGILSRADHNLPVELLPLQAMPPGDNEVL